ncbi:MAG: type II toxin-antitoxin system prevent-host-death family antitoxin [Gammaproteobacteria bacterium]|nr:type II toxin-antitoxin system prevent-host-death family antitoxin [Gammaproteobacteria bacterium]
MEQLDVFTARDLRNRTGELLKDAEAGQVSLITKHGKPAILAIPFDKWLLNHGVHRAMALHLFESHQLTMAQSAKVADLSLEAFIELLEEAGIAAVDYPPEELDDEMAVAL